MKIIKAFLINIMFVAFYGNAQASVEADCTYLTGSAELQLLAPIPGPDPVGFGSIIYVIDSDEFQASVTAFMPGPMLSNPDGSLNLPLELLHEFGDGTSLRWYAKAVLIPTQIPGVFDLNETVSVIDASGSFDGAMGRGIGHGTVSFLDFTASITAEGFVCVVEDEDEDEDEIDDDD